MSIQEISFRENVNLMFTKAVSLVNLPRGLEEALRVCNNTLRVVALQQLASRTLFNATGITRMPIIVLIFKLIARQMYFLSIHNDNVITAIHMRCISRLVLTS